MHKMDFSSQYFCNSLNEDDVFDFKNFHNPAKLAKSEDKISTQKCKIPEKILKTLKSTFLLSQITINR